MSSTKLWYTHPPAEYIAALPIGTGRLAAMVLGDPAEERLALNHEWLWRGVHRTRDTEPASHLLPEVRALLMSGQYEEGTLKGNQAFGGLGGTASSRTGWIPTSRPATCASPSTTAPRPTTAASWILSAGWSRSSTRPAASASAASTWPTSPTTCSWCASRPIGPSAAASGSIASPTRSVFCCEGAMQREQDSTAGSLDGQFHRGIAFRAEARLYLKDGAIAGGRRCAAW